MPKNDDRDKLILDNLNLVHYVLHTFYPKWAFDEDLRQCGMVGLVKAADGYDESKGTFANLAVNCIRNEIRNEFKIRGRQPKEVSMSTVVCEDGDTEVTLEDTISGENDVNFCDTEGRMALLIPIECEIVKLLQLGLNEQMIGERLGLSTQRINQLKRRIRLKWRHKYE